MATKLVPIPLAFWRAETGREPARDFLQELPKEDRQRIGRDIRKLQYGWPVGLPLVRKLRDGLWELRSSLPSKREARLLFAPDGDRLVLLHAFVKKTQKKPRIELELAYRRLKESQ